MNKCGTITILLIKGQLQKAHPETKHDVIKRGQMKVKLTSMTLKAYLDNLGLCKNHYAKVGYCALIR